MCLLISGGHALITWVESVDKFQILGRNLDAAPGDVFDKVARRLKLANVKPEYRSLSGGALIELFARKNGDPFAVQFNSLQTRWNDCNFSFSGLMSSAIRKIERIEEENYIFCC
uniref:Gcp-like domain-containing protein n=1 Tax=Romanomermis culicivorax TaxID=13658 RepID=A0A915KI79_ROMCU